MNANDYELLCGDCASVMADMDDGCVDMVLTSPPYDSMRAYNGFSIDLDAVIDGIYHVLRQGGICVWVTGDQMVRGSESCTSFRTALKFVEHGFLLHDTMIYQKQNPLPNITNDRVRYHQSFEYMFCFAKGKPTTFNPIVIECSYAGELRQRTYRIRGKDGKDCLENRGKSSVKETKVANNVFAYTVGMDNTTSYRPALAHPAVFPEQLARDQILSWTNEGDTVLDPMCGSGTTIFCAHALGRKSIGIDVSHEYIDLTEQRLNEQQLPSWSVKVVGE